MSAQPGTSGDQRSGTNGGDERPPSVDLVLGDPDGSPLLKAMPVRKLNKRFQKEDYAYKIGMVIVIIFGICMVAAFAFSWWAVAAAIRAQAVQHPADPWSMSQLASAIGDFLEPVKVIGTIFSSLLAFILGYYFNVSAHSRGRSSDDDD
jgi:hypothetical protein